MAKRTPNSTLTLPAAAPPSRIRARVLIIEARYYEKIAEELIKGAREALDAVGVAYDRVTVPGALEIPQALAAAVSAGLIPRNAQAARYDGAIALGCVIRGETAHFDVVCNNANHWLMEVAIRHGVPVGNGILTVENEAQAIARAKGGRNGKGGEAAQACLRLVELARDLVGQGT